MAVKRDPEWDDDLEDTNWGKVGRPFKYSHYMMAFVAITRVVLNLSY